MLVARIMLWLALAAWPLAAQAQRPPAAPFPEPSRESKPWTYWWWMGSGVDPANLTRELERYQKAGLGGVHIIPIYEAKGYENRSIPYLSQKWMAMLRHTVREADRLGLGVDMTTGSGWCFGGPNVSPADACAVVSVKTFDVTPGGELAETFDRKTTQALAAVSSTGERVELTGRIDAGGKVKWVAPSESWRVYAVSQQPCRQGVKRAGPGGEGPMLDPYRGESMRRYLVRFTEAFANYEGPRPRAMYHDSFEYQGNWSKELLAEFEKRRGYRLEKEIDALFGNAADDRSARVRGDYRQTLSDLMVEDFAATWTRWARDQNFRTRYQAHGSPGNLLDLYALADIPETEMFHADRSTAISKFASSAAHVSGRPLVSAETGTWLAEHFTETLAELKDLADQMFLAGVNHIFYHGTCYSPNEAPWPGWIFYASTQMNPRNPFWRDVPALNAYIARVQAVLQSGTPDSDILLYWPVWDTWHDAKGLNLNFTVHERKWLEDHPAGKSAGRLLERGYSYDFVSDRQLAGARVASGRLTLAGGSYGVIAVPVTDHMPVTTLAKLLDLAKAGATVVFAERLPYDVPGFGFLDQRRTALRTLADSVQLGPPDDARVRQAKLGAGRLLVGDLEAALTAAGARRETLADQQGLSFVRRVTTDGRFYFVTNRGTSPVDGWVPLATAAPSAWILDPMTGASGVAAVRGSNEVYLQLEPGQSVLIRTNVRHKFAGPPWIYRKLGDGSPVEGSWDLQFTAGGPEMPAPMTMGKLESWAGGDPLRERFGGTAKYSIAFDAPPAAAGVRWVLDLGDVRESARVRLNGKDLGAVIQMPYRVLLSGVRPGKNALEVEVTNLAANRVRDLDRRKVPWHEFHDIGLVNLAYKPFDSSAWPVRESGLLGPVKLRPAKAFTPR